MVFRPGGTQKSRELGAPSSLTYQVVDGIPQVIVATYGTRELLGVHAETGKIMWQEDQPGGGSAAVLYADGHLYFRYQDNVLALIEANPHAYKLKGEFKLPKRKSMSGNGWAHPVIVDGKLYLRHADVLLVYDVKG